MISSDFLTYTLANGIRLIHQQTNSPVAHLGVLINTGSRDELPDEHGLAHFIEHSVFKGTRKRRAFHVLSRIEDVGGELNAYTTKEETTLHSTFLREDYERAAEYKMERIRIGEEYDRERYVWQQENTLDETVDEDDDT